MTAPPPPRDRGATLRTGFQGCMALCLVLVVAVLVLLLYLFGIGF